MSVVRAIQPALPWTAAQIIRAISRQTLQRKCIVLVDNCYWAGDEADVLGVTMNRRLIDVEVKISRADLKADAAKEKWWHPRPWSEWRNPDYKRIAREWPRRVWKHYYAMPAAIWKPELLAALPSPKSGVLLLKRGSTNPEFIHVHCERRATPNKDADRLSPEDCLDIARLANIRMWDAYVDAHPEARPSAPHRVERPDGHQAFSPAFHQEK